jgi:hypothetical protein
MPAEIAADSGCDTRLANVLFPNLLDGTFDLLFVPVTLPQLAVGRGCSCLVRYTMDMVNCK